MWNLTFVWTETILPLLIRTVFELWVCKAFKKNITGFAMRYPQRTHGKVFIYCSFWAYQIHILLQLLPYGWDSYWPVVLSENSVYDIKSLRSVTHFAVITSNNLSYPANEGSSKSQTTSTSNKWIGFKWIGDVPFWFLWKPFWLVWRVHPSFTHHFEERVYAIKSVYQCSKFRETGTFSLDFTHF